MSSPKSLESRGASVAARIEQRLAVEILRGERPAGSQLPPVRALAQEFGVTPPTLQRVIDRLESAGLVSVRRGSGVRVNDPRRGFDLSLLPLWFEALADAPERAGEILSDYLELRRVMAAHLVRHSHARIAAIAGELAGLAAAVRRATSTTELARADLAVTRAIVDACGQVAVGAIFAVSERLIDQVPRVAAALYGDATYHRRMMGKVLAALATADADQAAARIERILAAWDRRSVDRFVADLRGEDS